MPHIIFKELNSVLFKYQSVMAIVQRIVQQEGIVLLVGGAVRDFLLGLEIKDLDIEVHGLSIEQLEHILQEFGQVSLVGKSFGVLRVHGLDIDFSLPRSDTAGRKPEVIIDPSMSFEKAFARRDLTINAMGINLQTFELIDPFNGYNDLQQKILRATDPDFFIEDPLRFYRVMQFIGRFEMQPDNTLNALCKNMDVSTVSRERIEAEFEKLFLKSRRPSLGIRWIHTLDRLSEVLPEIGALVGVQQNPKWHPEGDVFEHTMQTLDVAVQLIYSNSFKKLIMLYAALCHDIGKPVTTTLINGKWTSYDHDNVGADIAKKFLRRITRNTVLINSVYKLVKYHMMPVQFIQQGAKPVAYKRLARKLAPEATLQMLADLSRADKCGRVTDGHLPVLCVQPEIDSFLKKAEKLQVLEKVEEPLLLGRDLLGIIEPGPKMGELVKRAYDLQLEKGIKDKEELMKRVLQRYKKN